MRSSSHKKHLVPKRFHNQWAGVVSSVKFNKVTVYCSEADKMVAHLVAFHLLTLPLSNKTIVDTSNIHTVVQRLPPLLCIQVLCLCVELAQGAIFSLNTKQVSVVEDGVQHCNCAAGIAQPIHLPQEVGGSRH